MSAKITKSQALQMAEELVTLQPMVERYKVLEAELKTTMQHLELDGIETRTGRIKMSVTERMTISPATARHVLGEEMARKVIQVKETVSSRLLKTFHEVGDVTAGQMDDLNGQAKKSTVIRLHIRPLK